MDPIEPTTSGSTIRAIFELHTEPLELLRRGSDIHTVLEVIARTGESFGEFTLGIMLLGEEGTLYHSARPSISDDFCRNYNELDVKDGFGSCGTAARLKKEVLSDIASDPAWDSFRHLAIPHGFRSCWSIPVLSVDEMVLGTFAVYYRTPAGPTESDRLIVHYLVRTTAVVIEWFRDREQLGVMRDDFDKQKRLLEAIATSTPDLVYAFNLDYTFSYANNALLEMWGRTLEDSIGRGLRELGYEDWHAEMHEREIDTVVATKKPIRGEVSFPHATLGRRVYDYIFAPVLNADGNVEVVSGTTRDISDLKLAQDALRASEEQFRTLTESLPQLVWTAGPDGKADFVNKRWYEYTGSAPEESLSFNWLQFLHPNDADRIYAQWNEDFKSGEYTPIEFRLRRHTGEYHWFYSLATAIRDDNGSIVKWVGALTNIEERKSLEQQLESLVAQRTAELKRSNDDLLHFAHVASHDLKEPVRKIKIFAGRLEEDRETNISPSGKVFLEKIHSSADRMYEMVEGVLAYSSLSNMDAQREPVDLFELLQSVESDLEVPISQKQAILVYDKVPVISGIPILLYQLFYNLIQNSLKFARPDVPPRIEITAAAMSDSNRIVIRVRDNGIGFPQEQAGKIFKTFVRLHSKDQFEGSGLGLALCKRIAERHGGTITATGLPDDGAEFQISISID